MPLVPIDIMVPSADSPVLSCEMKEGRVENTESSESADAIDSIPIALAQNAGMNVIDSAAELHSRHRKGDDLWIGVDVKGMKIADMRHKNIIEPWPQRSRSSSLPLKLPRCS